MIREREITPLPGLPILLILILVEGPSIWGVIAAAQADAVGLILACLLLAVLG